MAKLNLTFANQLICFVLKQRYGTVSQGHFAAYQAFCTKVTANSLSNNQEFSQIIVGVQ